MFNVSSIDIQKYVQVHTRGVRRRKKANIAPLIDMNEEGSGTVLPLLVDFGIDIAISQLVVKPIVNLLVRGLFDDQSITVISILLFEVLEAYFPSISIIIDLFIELITTLFTDGLFATLAVLLFIILPRLIAALIVFLMDLLSFLYYLPLGIGSAIRSFRDELEIFANGGSSPSNIAPRNVLVRNLTVVAIICYISSFDILGIKSALHTSIIFLIGAIGEVVQY